MRARDSCLFTVKDMRGSGVHAAMLARQGIISEQDCADILSGLASIADDLSSGALTIDPAAEDVHTFVEQTLTARIGDAGKRLHTGRSRNDQVALDIRLTKRQRKTPPPSCPATPICSVPSPSPSATR